MATGEGEVIHPTFDTSGIMDKTLPIKLLEMRRNHAIVVILRWRGARVMWAIPTIIGWAAAVLVLVFPT